LGIVLLMGLLDPIPPPYDALEWEKRPFAERARMACEAWALQGYGTPLVIYIVYALKVAAYIGGWIWFCSFTPGLGNFATISSWWLDPVAFQKAILWSMLFEVLGLGCGSGPLTGRYYPPLGGFLYFLRPGTTKLALFDKWPLLGGIRRTWLDVAFYGAALICLVRALVAPTPGPLEFLPVVILFAILGLLDKTIFLAARAEHYWTTIVCFAFASQWIAGAKAVQLALWFWAGVSKLNAHFPTVVAVMTSNGPFTRAEWLRRRVYRHYPDDLRPSRLAVWMAHGGKLLELGVPLILMLSPGGTSLLVGMILMLMLHGYITSNVPMGVPIEWNVMVVYGAFALFWAHPDINLLDVGPWPLGIFLGLALIGIPLLGNLVPSAVSFLLAMRYYAGNWAYGIWLFRKGSHTKLEKLTKSSGWVFDQLGRFYDQRTSVGLVGKVFAFRLMHLHGRAISALIPKAVDRFEDYEYMDGEIVAGIVLGYNFGDGHLHNEKLLRAVQEQCGFDAGELRCMFVEAQPLGRQTLEWRVVDAKTGLIEKGTMSAEDLQRRQPWEAPIDRVDTPPLATT
jgi:hypothetical protein